MVKEIEVNQYPREFDTTLTRTINECERLWNKQPPFPGTFDKLVSAQVEKTIGSQRDKVVVVDLGSGDGTLFYDAINDQVSGSEMTRTRELLSQNPNMKVRMVGLDDAPSEEVFLKGISIQDYDGCHTFSQVTAENVYYSLTRNQTLGKFLESLKIPKVDLILGTSFFQSLEPVLFEQVLRDAVKALRSGGVLYGQGIALDDIVPMPPELTNLMRKLLIYPNPQDRAKADRALKWSLNPTNIRKVKQEKAEAVKRVRQSMPQADITFINDKLLVKKK